MASILQGRVVNKGLIIYESKNDHEIIEFLVNKDQTIINEMLRYSDFVWRHVAARKEPKTPFEPDSYECSYCPYYERCHGKPKPEKFIDKGIWGAANAKELSGEPKF